MKSSPDGSLSLPPKAAMRYRAKRACIAGGAFRRAGDVFEHEPYPAVPDHLEALDPPEAPALQPDDKPKPARPTGEAKKDDKADPQKDYPGPSLADLGEGTPANAADFDSTKVLKP